MSFDRNNPVHLAALKTEVNTDPNGYGYVPDSTQEGVLDIINLKRPEITVSKPNIGSAGVRSSCTYAAYDGLAIDEQEWLRWMTPASNDENMVVTTDLRERLTGGSASIWAPADRVEMIAAMLALIDIDGSRSEEMFGIYTNISRDDWIAARDS